MDDDLCQVCGRVPTAVVRGYHDHPFVDGRNYSIICWTCACIIKHWYETKDGEVIILKQPDPEHLRTAKEMVEDGWDKEDAEYSIKAIQRKLKTQKITISSGTQHIYSQLYLSSSKKLVFEL